MKKNTLRTTLLAGALGATLLVNPVTEARADTSPTEVALPSLERQIQDQISRQMQETRWLNQQQQLDIYYQIQTGRAGGTWRSQVRLIDGSGVLKSVIEDDIDVPTWAYSVNKIPVALAILDKVDRGLLKLDQKLELTPDIIAQGSGVYHLQGVYGDNLTLANLMTAMLLNSDNTAVRMLSRVADGHEINQILSNKGFKITRVEPIEGSTRFYLGQTTAREMNSLLEGVANHSLISEKSATFMLNIMRWVNGYNDGVRRNMSSQGRILVASKYGAFEDSRNEVGIIFDPITNQPAAIYTFFNEFLGGVDNYGSTNPAVEAEATMGHELFKAVTAIRSDRQ